MTIRRSEGAEWLITGRASSKVSDPTQQGGPNGIWVTAYIQVALP
jgi:hypothetical protein